MQGLGDNAEPARVFKKASWIHHTNVYEVNLRQYTAEGSFTAFENELDRLKDMGVKTLWFMPLTPISQKNRKGNLGSYYACSDYISINPEFGRPEDLKKLIGHAHQMGFKILIDWVANHTGWDHVWTREYPGYYLTDDQTGTFKIASGMDDIIELDFSNQAMRAAMINAMEFWVKEYDIDGFRCDLAFWVRVDFWIEARTALEKIKTLFWLAEADPLEFPEYLVPFDAAYTWTWMHKTESFYKSGGDISMLMHILNGYAKICGNKSIPLWFTANHDENSWNGTEYEKYGKMAQVLTVFNFTWNGMPMIYSGQELPNLKRLQFFEKDVIEWNEAYQLHDFYKTLAHLHTYNKALRAADPEGFTFIFETNKTVLAFHRENGDHGVLALLNFSDEMISLELDTTRLSGTYRNIFDDEKKEPGADCRFELTAWGWLLYEKIQSV